ncbi:MAG: hypothetical protein ACUVV3_06345 [Dehalococcoidia bacterium]
MASAKTGRRRVRDFYRAALSEAEKWEWAREMEGLDAEVALLRVKLKEALEERPEDLQLIAKGIDLLVKAVAAKYRLSPRAQKDLSDSIAGVVRSLGAVLYPEGWPHDG